MKITIISVGKLKEPFLREGILEYSKRLKKYCQLEILEVEDEKTLDSVKEELLERIRQKEGDKILRKLPEKSYLITLEIEGKNFSSIELANHIQEKCIEGQSHLTFVIGGSLGLSKEVRERSHLKLSFGKMTYPHQLMRVILLEQIYRSFRIIHKEPYHK